MFEPSHQAAAPLDPAPSSPAIFASIIPSRPVQTGFAHLPPNRFVLQLDEPESINHLVVFLTGIVPLPDGYGASVHFLFPNKSDWLLLGMLSSAKPSAIFRLRGAAVRSQAGWAMPAAQTATLGILVAPLGEVEAECAHLNQALTLRPNPTPQLPDLAKAIGLNLFRYLASFAASPTTLSNDAWIPIAVLEKWWKQFEIKLCGAADPEKWLLESAQNC